MDDPFRRKTRGLVMQLVGQWTAHGKHINGEFSLNASAEAARFGENEFFRTPRTKPENEDVSLTRSKRNIKPKCFT